MNQIRERNKRHPNWKGRSKIVHLQITQIYTVKHPKDSTKTLFQFSSVAQLCLTLCDPLDCSMPGFPVHHQPPELVQTHVHWSVMPSNHLTLCHPLLLCLQSFPASRSFLRNLFFTSGGQSTRALASASVLPMNIQDWFPLGWTDWISLQSKGLLQYHSSKASIIWCSAFFIVQLLHP